MKKYKNYIVVTIVLLIVAGFFYLKEKPGTLKVDRKLFAVTDTAAVKSISFDKGTSRLVLERSISNWRVNHNYNANPRAIKGLLHLLMGLEINSPVPKSMRNEALQSFDLGSLLISVEMFDNEIRSFRIAENDSLKIGTLMWMQNNEEPYIVAIPGYKGRILPYFSTDEKKWRDKSVFRYRPDDIRSIEIEYKSNPQASFGYYFHGPDKLQVRSINSNQSVSINKETAINYLKHFSSVTYLNQVIERSKAIKDSLNKQQPYCEIRINNILNQVNVVKTFQIPLRDKRGAFNPDFMYAVIQDDTIPVIVKYIDFDPIMKEYNDFVTR